MSMHESSLPEAWVERIWATMRAFYGAAFDRQWECPPGVDPARHVADLKAVWGRELRHLQQNPAAIAHGLERLPEHPPNLPQFRALCCPPPAAFRALPVPQADPAVVARVMSGFKRPVQRDLKAWARDFRAAEERGEHLSLAQKAAWRNALSVEPAFGGEQ